MPTHQTTELAELETPSRRFHCRHILADGHRCGSPALRRQNFCYYHHATRGAAATRLARSVRGLQPALPEPCDLAERSGIQLALAEVLHLIAANDIDTRRAGLLLYGLQTAANILPRSTPNSTPPPPIEDFNIDPEFGYLALPSEIDEIENLGSAGRLLRKWKLADAQQQAHQTAPVEAQPAPSEVQTATEPATPPAPPCTPCLASETWPPSTP